MNKTVQPITGRKAGEFCRLLEKRGIGDREFQQYLIEHPDDLVNYIRAAKESSWQAVGKVTPSVHSIVQLNNLNPFFFEGLKEVSRSRHSSSGEWRLHYPPGFSVLPLDVHVERLRTALEGFVPTFSQPSNEISLPDGADGVALIPSITFLGKLWGIREPHGIGYKEVLRRINMALEKNRPADIFNYHQAYEFIRINPGVLEVLLPLEEKAERAGLNCLALPFSFGRLYADFGCRNARWTALYDGQLPLTTVQTGCLLLAMPNRLVSFNDLPVDCPGDECDRHDSDHYPNGTGKWYEFLGWEITEVKGYPIELRLNKTSGYGDTGMHGGPAVAFLPLK
ncbi:MAG: hypothetical protein NT170_04660 [Candidatus Moranbacteria bacterium]|nr:hypothetical protein [Candidatus Moranbacteria bacterium]